MPPFTEPSPYGPPALPGAPVLKPRLSAPDPDTLAQSAWERINEAMHCGAMFMPSGRVVVLGPKEQIHLIQWLATQRVKRPRAVHKPEDFLPKPTGGPSVTPA